MARETANLKMVEQWLNEGIPVIGRFVDSDRWEDFKKGDKLSPLWRYKRNVKEPKRSDLKCCGLCKFWNCEGIQHYCFIDKGNLVSKTRFEKCEKWTLGE